MAGRQRRGRQRIPMRLIENQDDLYATFSKRRLRLYKKASELSTLCGVDIGVIIFSPTGNPFSFFHPNMESVVERYRNPNQPLSDYARVVEAHTRARIEHLNQRLDEILEENDLLKEQEKQFIQLEKTQPRGWWEQPVHTLNKDQVKEWKAFLQDFSAKVNCRIEELKNGTSSSSAVTSTPFQPINNPNALPQTGTTMAPNLYVQNDDGAGPSSFAPPPLFHDQTMMSGTAQFYVPPQGQIDGPLFGGGSGGQQYSIQYNYNMPPPQNPSGSSGSGLGQSSVQYGYGYLPPPLNLDPSSSSVVGGSSNPPIQYNYMAPPLRGNDPSSSGGGANQAAPPYYGNVDLGD